MTSESPLSPFQYYKVPVYGGADGRTILSEQELFDQLKSCVSPQKNQNPIGILSSDNRDNWAVAYQELIKDPLNKSSVEVIQKSLFTLSLDDLVPQNDTYYNLSCHQLITGGGAQFNVGNRWYDKTVQVRRSRRQRERREENDWRPI